jgi:protein TonB
VLFAHLLSNLFCVSSGKAFTLSALVHFGALVLLAQSWVTTTADLPRLAGSRQVVIQLKASFLETPAPDPVVVPTMAVEVTPNVAWTFDRTFVQTPSAAVDWNLDAMLRAADSEPSSFAAPAVTRADETDRLSTTDPPQTIELPRSEIETTPPTTSTDVPAMLGDDRTTPPQYDFIPPPRYPDLARRRGWQGTVLLVVKIDASGRVTDVAVEESSGYELLDAAAVGAVRRWRYKPAIGRNGPVATTELQPVTFRLPR